jgi:hypothetical protein
MKIPTGAEKLYPKLREVIGRPKQRFIVKELYQMCVLAVLWTVKFGVTKVQNQVQPVE